MRLLLLSSLSSGQLTAFDSCFMYRRLIVNSTLRQFRFRFSFRLELGRMDALEG